MPLNNQTAEFEKGQKLFVTLSDNRSLEAVFNRKSEARRSILFRNVSFVPDGKTFEQLEFKFDQILKITCLETEKKEENIEYENVNQSNSSDTTQNIQNGVLYEKVKMLAEKHKLIDQIDENFAEAIKVIDQVEIVAVNGEGSYQGRFGHLTVLGIATHSSVYLFDIVNLGARVFKAGGNFLKKILESKRLLKVVHNCCCLSDCLKHTYGITLQNVFDTQACHYIIVKNKSGLPPTSAPFSNLISEYLNLPGALSDSRTKDLDKWRQRPLDSELAMGAAWRVALLRKLKSPMDDALHAPFDKLCQFYVNSVRDIDDEFEAKMQVQRQEEGVLPTGI